MANSNVPTAGEGEPLVSPLPLDSEAVAFAGQLCVPRPTANQVIVWFALTVVLIGITLVMSALETKATEHLHFPPGSVILVWPWWQRMIHWLYVPSFAACLVASIVLIRSRCLRMLDRLQPGHWLVLILVAVGIVGCITRSVVFFRTAWHLSAAWGNSGLDVMWWLSSLVIGVTLVFAAVRLHDAKRWKVLLVSAAVSLLCSAIPTIPVFRESYDIIRLWRWTAPWQFALVAVIAFVVIALDWPQRARRDWPHWLGVSLWTLANVAAVLTHLHVYTR
jgi:hypothetical protein